MTKIVYIHGANATGDSFNYIRKNLRHNDEIVLEYDSANGFDNNLEMMRQQLENYDGIFFICHSLGGIYALHLANIYQDRVLGAVTLSTPYGGAESAEYTRHLMPFSKLLKDISPSSGPMRRARELPITHPWTNVVSLRGNSPWIIHPNDGVVTIKSMRCREDMELKELDVNHYEVVLNKKTIALIKNALREVRNEKQ
jgi:pimeloyl-ACP methyl ester carboxylesterase